MALRINSLVFIFLNAFLCAAEIIIPSTVQAGTAVDVTINQDLWNYGTEFVGYVRIYLALEDHWGEQCTLIPGISLCDKDIEVGSGDVDFKNKTFSITIPKDVGPPGLFYYISAEVWQVTGERYGGGDISNKFNLSGATGKFSQTQLSGNYLWRADWFPCASSACVQACEDVGHSNTLSQGAADSPWRRCVNACPDISPYFNTTDTMLIGSDNKENCLEYVNYNISISPEYSKAQCRDFPIPAACPVSIASTSTSSGPSDFSSTVTATPAQTSKDSSSPFYPIPASLLISAVVYMIFCIT